MGKFVDTLPDDWRSAWRAARALSGETRRTEHPYRKRIVGFGVPFVAGVALYLAATKSPLSVEAASSILTLVAILAGFIVNALLATVRIADADALSLELARAYVAKVRFLVQSQIITLSIYLITALSAIVVLVLVVPASAVDLTGTGRTIAWGLSSVVAGLCLSSLVRSAVLPYQIYEVQRFSLDEFLARKERLLIQEKMADLRQLRANGDR